MDAFIISSEDTVDITVLEVKELLGKTATKLHESCIITDCSLQDIVQLTYHCQSAKRVCILLSKLKLSNYMDEEAIRTDVQAISTTLDENILQKLSKDTQTFGVFVHKTKYHKLSSPDLAGIIGEQLTREFERMQIPLSVDLKTPDLPILSSIDENSLLTGLDLAGFPLEKRPYKLISHPSSLNGAFAYSLLRLAGITKKSKVLDPFCSTGTLIIEAALFQEEQSCFYFHNKFSGLRIPFTKKEFEKEVSKLQQKQCSNKQLLFGFDGQVKMMLAAQKNAKIAGIFEAVKFSKASIDWIDTKFDKNEIDCIITNPPKISKRMGNTKKILKLYDDLFFQAAYLLKEGGSLAILLVQESSVLEIAEKHHFELQKNVKINSGEQTYKFIIFSNKRAKSI